MDNQLLLEANVVGKNFGSVRALHNLSFALHKGSILALLGPNGAGKTTFLRLVLGNLLPDGGDIQISGQTALACANSDALNVVGLLDETHPPKSTTLKTLILFQSAVSGKAFQTTELMTALSEAGLKTSQNYGSLSKGQKKWVLSMLTLYSGAPVLLFDEPADGLDPAMRQLLYKRLRSLVNEGETSVIIATHIISDIEKVADDVAIIDKGQLVLHGDLEEIRESYGTLRGDLSHVDMDSCDIVSLHKTSEVTLIRCHDKESFETSLPPSLSLSSVDLEELYLLITKK